MLKSQTLLIPPVLQAGKHFCLLWGGLVWAVAFLRTQR